MSKRSEAKRKPCAACNKPNLRKTRYYRDGSFFCSNGCYRKFAEKKAKQEASV